MVIFTLLSSFFGGAFSIVKKIFSFVVSDPKIALIIVILLAALAGGLYIKHDLDEDATKIAALTQQNTTLVAQNTQLQKDVATAKSVNDADQVTISQLSLAKTDSDNRIAQMQKAQQANTAQIGNLQKMIANSKPADNGKVANVLAETINAIQQQRKQGLGQ
jgi:hypothetical protein